MLFGFYFLKLFLKIILKKKNNPILILYENYSCYVNLVFVVFLVSLKTKKKIGNQICFMYFPCSHCLNIYIYIYRQGNQNPFDEGLVSII